MPSVAIKFFISATKLQPSAPPSVPLKTERPEDLLRLLEYAGISYGARESPAAKLGVETFRAGREFALRTDRTMIAFDWDHTIDNYKIFEDLIRLIRTKLSGRYPYKKDYPMTALETARPFMHELVLGMMAGFGVRQGLENFTQWRSYRPQVGLATQTWPDRLGVLSEYIPLIPLMDARFPGEPESYETTIRSKTFVHLHDFLSYAEELLTKFEKGDFKALTPKERDEVMMYLYRGKAHNVKPLGAMAKKWEVGALMLFDDSYEVYQSYQEELTLEQIVSVYTQNPYLKPGEDEGELYKLSPGLTRQSRIKAAARKLAEAESRTAVRTLLGHLQNLLQEGTKLDCNLSLIDETPEGVVLRMHETGTTLPEFHRYYVEPTRRVKQQIERIIQKWGGLDAIDAACKISRNFS
jgi:hypothetical protein